MPIVSQVSHQFNSDGRIFTVKAETQSTHEWVNGEPVFNDNEVVVLESTNSEGYDRKLQVVMPLAAAIEFAKAVLAAQQQAAEDALIEAMYQRHLDHEALMDDAIEHDYAWIRQGC